MRQVINYAVPVLAVIVTAILIAGMLGCAPDATSERFDGNKPRALPGVWQPTITRLAVPVYVPAMPGWFRLHIPTAVTVN